MEWRTILLISLGLISIVPAHLAAFTLALPPEMRLFLDVGFKFSFSYLFLCYAVLSGLIARYSPVVILGMIGFVHSMLFDKTYYQRGYRRVYVSFTGVGKSARKFDSIDDLRLHWERVKKFGRSDARLSNLRKNDFQKRFPVSFYEKHRWIITALLSIIFFSYLYVGAWRASALFVLLVFIFSGLTFYDVASSGYRFSLSRGLWLSEEESPGRLIDMDDVLSIVAVIAIASALSGYLRVGYLSRDAARAQIFQDGDAVAAVAAVSAGVIVYDSSLKDFYIVPWSSRP